MQYDQKQFTQNGLNMFSDALSKKESITVDKVIVDDLPTNNFSNLALLSLDSFADAMSFQANYTETSGNTLTVDAVMSNKGFTSSYTINELGLVGHIGDDVNNQSLMAVLVASDPFTLPAQQSNDTPSEFIPNITIQLANDDMGQVPVMVSNDAYIAQKDLDKLVSDDGYIKLTDADNRYVKQSDFQNEVNNSVDEKADKSYVDQNINQTNNEISNKANKTDLSNLQSNINNDVQPQLNQKANQSDLNTTNSNVSSNSNSINSLDSNKADKGDVNGQINQTLSQATAHSDQNLSTAKGYSDNHYNDLSDKNDILSNKVEDYQKPNLAPVDTKNETIVKDTGIAHSLGQVHLEAGKQYCISIDYITKDSDNWSDFNLNRTNFLYGLPSDAINQHGDKGERAMGYNPASGNWMAEKHPIVKYTPKNDLDLNLNVTSWGSVTNHFGYKNFMVTQTSDVIPYSIAEQNKASIESEEMLTNDYQAPNLVDGSSDWQSAYGNSADNNWSGDIAKVDLEAGKKYWVSAYTKNDTNSGFSLGINQNSQNNNWYAVGSTAWTGYYHGDWNMFIRNGTRFVKFSFIAPTTQTYYVDYAKANGNDEDSHYRNLTVTQSDEFVPYEVAQRNKLWNDRITNKTDILSDQLNSHFGTGTIQNGYNLNNYTWNGTFNLYGVDIGTLIGNDGLPKDYNGFYGIMVVEVSNGYAYQILYDNTNNQWFRYVGNGVTWHQVAIHDDVQSKYDSLNDAKQDKSDSTDKFNWMNTVKHNTADANQQFSQAIAHADQIGNNKEDDQDSTNKFNYLNGVKANTTDVNNKINQLASNSWRELSVNGLSSHIGGSIFCKVDWNNNTATLSGMSTNGRSPSGNNDVITIVSSNDFSFTNFSGNVTEFKSQEEGTWNSDTVSVNAIGGNLISGINNGAFNITLTMATETGQSITVPIQPK